jgi:UDP-N-acetylmuramoyl-tripeptide--D-alanyl-D-alanine ligase
MFKLYSNHGLGGNSQLSASAGQKPPVTPKKTPVQRTLILRKPVIAITGSAGKTTTKEMIASILARSWQIYKSKSNMNYIDNTQRHVRRILPNHRAVVLEFGIMRSGDIRRHCQFIQPNFGVITNIGTAHVGNFNGQMAGVAMAKSELIRYMKPNGIIFLNADCKYSRKMTAQPYRGRFGGMCVTVGINRPATYRAYNVRYAENGMTFECKLRTGVYTFYIPVVGKHNIYNALFAIAVARFLGFPPDVIQEGLRRFARPPRRLRRYELSNGIQVIDDTFSANPHAVKAALDVLSEVGKTRKIAVLGSMLEMGRHKVKGHVDVGKYLAKKQVDYLYTYGVSGKYIGIGAVQAGFPAKRVFHCGSKAQLHRKLARQIKPETSILVKGSHKLEMNKTVRFIRSYARIKMQQD